MQCESRCTQEDKQKGDAAKSTIPATRMSTAPVSTRSLPSLSDSHTSPMSPPSEVADDAVEAREARDFSVISCPLSKSKINVRKFGEKD